MKVLQTRRGIDPMWQKWIADLETLVKLSGGVRRLSKLLGIKEATIYSWGRNGRISPLGALLCQKSAELGDYFQFTELRPDLTDKDANNLQGTKEYKKSRGLQQRYESTKAFNRDSVIQALTGYTDAKEA